MRIAKGTVKVVLEFTIKGTCQFNSLYHEDGRELIQDIVTEDLFSKLSNDLDAKIVSTSVEDYEEVAEEREETDED